MVFLGRSFCGDRNSLNYTPTNINDIQKLRIQNGNFDTLHVNRDSNYSGDIPDSKTGWNYDTILLALFDSNLLAGNIDYAVSQVSSIRVKGRTKGSFNWITYYEIPITKIEDFYFTIYHKYCKSKTNYEFALVPVIGNVEGNININSVYSEFEGLFIIEKDKSYSTMITLDSFSLQKNKPSTYVQTINRKYPYVFNSGMNNFHTGSVSGEFIASNQELLNTADYNGLLKDSVLYREDFMDFLTNGNVKILKLHDGRMWMISVINTPSEQADDIAYTTTTSFEWVEIGDIDSTNDLFDYNFIDVNIEGT